MSDCPDLAALESGSALATEHVAQCSSCKMVMELLEERRRGIASENRRTECARFEMFLAEQAEGTLAGAAGALLEAHLRECADCRVVAATSPPFGNEPGTMALPAVATSAYALGREVARGGMGRILAAEDLRIGRRVAVKELLGKAPALAARFEREARLTARLQHPGIVPIYEIGRWPDGTPFYAMRMVDGRTLRQAIREKSSLEERLALLPGVIAAADAVAFAHSNRIIHRDLTPNNILIGAHGDTVVIDWGLAKDLDALREERDVGGPYRDDRTADQDLTSLGAVIGTAAYMPPEQARGERVDERADVYALGAILYHVLAGEPPYRASKSDDVVRQVQAAPPPAVSSVAPGAPRDLVSILEKAMARDSADRYPTAAVLVAELRRFQTGRLVEAHEYSRRERVVRWIRAHRALALASISAIAVIPIVGSLALAGVLRERTKAEHERDAARASRMVSEQERHRADDLAVGLLEESGRRELLEGNRERAAVYLSAAYSRGSKSPALRFMLADAMASLDGEISRLSFAGATHGHFDHRGRLILVTQDNNRAAVFDSSTGEKLSDLEGAPFNPRVFSSDDKAIFGDSGDNLVRWDVSTGKQTASVPAHSRAFRLSRVFDEGRRLATVGEDGILKIWDAETLTVIAQRDVAQRGASELLASPDGRRLLWVDLQGGVSMWDTRDARLLYTLPPERGRRIAFDRRVFTPDGKRFVLGDLNGTVTMWDTETGRLEKSLPGHGAPVVAQFNPSGSLMLVVDFQRNGYVIDPYSDAKASTFHGDGVSFIPMFADDGMRIVAMEQATPQTGSVEILDMFSGTPILRYEGRPLMDAVASDRAVLSTGDGVRVVALDAGRLQRLLPHETLTAGWYMTDSRHVMTQTVQRRIIWAPDTLTNLVLPPDGELLETTADGSRQVVRTKSGAEIRDAKGAVVAKLEAADTSNVQVTPDDRRLAVADARGTIRILDVSTGTGVATLEGHGDKVVTFHCATMGRCASLDADGHIQVWTTAGARVTSCRPRDGHASYLRISRDGTRIVVMMTTATAPLTWQPVLYRADDCTEIAELDKPRKDRELNVEFAATRVLIDHGVWDIRDGHAIAEIPATQYESKLVLAPDGAHAATIYGGANTKLWSLDGEVTSHELDGDSTDGRFSPDGQLFFAANMKGAIDVVEVTTARRVGRLEMPMGALELAEGRNDLTMASFMIDMNEKGDRLVTSGPDTVARIWNIGLETRSPDETAHIVASRSLWKLDGANLVPSRVRHVIRGRVTRLGKPAANATVFIDSPTAGESRAAARSGVDGAYFIEVPIPRSYKLHAVVDNVAFALPRAVDVTGSEAHLDIELDLAGSISGIVRDETGKPRAGLRVLVKTPEERGETETAADGTYTIGGLSGQRTYTIHVFTPSGLELAAATSYPSVAVADGNTHVQNIELIVDTHSLERDLDLAARYRIESADSGKALAVTSYGELTLADKNAAVLWKLTPMGSGYLRLTIATDGDRMSLDGNRLAATGPYTGQAWKLIPEADGLFRMCTLNGNAGRSLDSRTRDLAPTASVPSQRWRFVPVK